jgi:hypothetical protein
MSCNQNGWYWLTVIIMSQLLSSDLWKLNNTILTLHLKWELWLLPSIRWGNRCWEVKGFGHCCCWTVGGKQGRSWGWNPGPYTHTGQTPCHWATSSPTFSFWSCSNDSLSSRPVCDHGLSLSPSRGVTSCRGYWTLGMHLVSVTEKLDISSYFISEPLRFWLLKWTVQF